MKKSLSANHENGKLSLYRSVLSIAWPAALEGALLSIIGSVDTMMVKEVDPYAIAAVSITGQPRMILLILAQALCVGTTALVARRKGEQNQKGANAVMAQSMLLVTFIGILISLLGYFFADPILSLAGADHDTGLMAAEYFRIISLGMIFNCWNLCLCASLRAIGNTRITMVTNITANIVNVFLNYCLIGGRLGFPKMGVRGAALATVIGTFVACCISFAFVLRKDGYLFLSFKDFHFDKRTMSGLVKVGSSSIAESAFLRLGFLINTRMIADIGADALTAFTIVSQVTSLSFTFGDGMGTAGATLIGQSLGAGEKDKAQKYIRICYHMSIVLSAILMVVIFFTRNSLALLFTDQPVIIAGASAAFIAAIIGMIPQNARVVFSGCLRGAGDVKFVAVCALISVTIVRPLFTWLCCYPLDRLFPTLMFAYTGPWISFVVDAVVRQVLLDARIRKGKFLDISL